MPETRLIRAVDVVSHIVDRVSIGTLRHRQIGESDWFSELSFEAATRR